jgi:YegS/Rv2252/BmrU family lipid kinase
VIRRFALVVNPAAAGGRALAVLPAVTAELDRLGAPSRSVVTRNSEHAAEEAARAAKAGETIGAVGGDGLLRPLATAVRGRRAAMALFPCGRGNDFARVLGVPRDPLAAARVAVVGEERLVDLAEVDGTPYVGIASLGFDSDANRIANEARLIKGNLVYLYAALRALAAWRPAGFTVHLDGERHCVIGYSVAVGNSKAYGGGMYLLPHAELDDGILEVLIIERHSKLRFLRDLPKVFKGTHLDSPRAHLLRGREVRVEADRPFEVYADGDPIGATPATMRVEHRSLRIIVPR